MGLLFYDGFEDAGCVTFIANMKQTKHTQGQGKHFIYRKCIYRRVMVQDFRGSFILASLNSKRDEFF